DAEDVDRVRALPFDVLARPRVAPQHEDEQRPFPLQRRDERRTVSGVDLDDVRRLRGRARPEDRERGRAGDGERHDERGGPDGRPAGAPDAVPAVHGDAWGVGPADGDAAPPAGAEGLTPVDGPTLGARAGSMWRLAWGHPVISQRWSIRRRTNEASTVTWTVDPSLSAPLASIETRATVAWA